MKNFKKYVTTERVVMVVIIVVGIVLFSYFWNEKKQDDLYMLGYRYQYGIDMPQDTVKAVECFKELAESGNVKAQFWLGKYYESLYDTIAGRPQAYAWYLKAANAGYPDAQNAVGECFYKGIGVEKDDKAAMAWFIKAAEQNSAAGQYNIGKCYHIGRGIEQDYKQAVAWYEKAVEQGYAKAQVNLGKCYIKGTGVEEDIEKGASLMVKAAIQSAPSRIVVANPAGKRTMFLERNNVYFGTGTDLPTHMDPYTKEVRPTVLKDIENIAKVVDKADNFAYVSNQGLAQDIPQHLHDMITLKAMRKYCAKPNLSTATDRGNLKCLIDMCAEMAGGYDELRRSPSIMLYNEPVSPLMNSEEAIQKLMLCAEYGIPTTYASGGVSGGTSPVTLSGSIVCSNASAVSFAKYSRIARSLNTSEPYAISVRSIAMSRSLKVVIGC